MRSPKVCYIFPPQLEQLNKILRIRGILSEFAVNYARRNDPESDLRNKFLLSCLKHCNLVQVLDNILVYVSAHKFAAILYDL